MKKLIFLLPLLIANLAIAQIPTDSLVGYWPFNGNANDESGNNLSTSIIGSMSYGMDRFGNSSASIVGNSSSDYVQLDSDLNLGTVHTISIWMKFYTYNAPMILNKWAEGGIFYFAIDKIYYRISSGSINSEAFTPENNTWYHILCIRNDLSVKYYINNIFLSESSLTTNSDEIVRTITKRYNNNDTAYYYLDGMLDDIRIYNRVLTESEITALYNENISPSPTNTWQQNGDDIYYDGIGNVGIGTNTPAAKLTVDGPILSTEVLVKTDISTYPDFVFKPEYKLRTIEETEQYIKENGHLPEIPKASEVEEGVNLGEMNTKLLQKIEELTLYTIEQQKKIDKLIEENKEQNMVIEELKNEVERGEINDK